MDKPIWRPSKASIRQSNLYHFMQTVCAQYQVDIKDYFALHHWSLVYPEHFWAALWDFCQVKASQPALHILKNGDKMPGASWFGGAKLNYAENLLRRRDNHTAIIAYREDGQRQQLSYQQLYQKVAQLAGALQQAGVKSGDHIAGFLPNIPETVIAMLASASLGAVWSACSPEFGLHAVLDRFQQIQPKILLATDGQLFNGKQHDALHKLAALSQQLNSLKKIIIIPFLQQQPDISKIRDSILFDDFLIEQSTIPFKQVTFDHPLYVMFTSGTTGVPKCIVHGVGGVLLQHLKELVLHTDLKPEDTIFYYTSCSWMMWHWLVSSLAVGATVVLYDGSPVYPRVDHLFNLIDKENITVFGTSAPYIRQLEKHDIKPVDTHQLTSLRTILSTGSPLAAESYDYVYRWIKKDVMLCSISGGTDIISCFALGNPILPIFRGELQASGLGMDLDILDDEGQSIRDVYGELVCRSPFPSMPLYFANDPGGEKFHQAYFARYPDVWAHGDYAKITRNGGVKIAGRSDAVLNRGGVRIGTAEIYRQVEPIDEVTAALAIEQQWQGDTRIILFVQLRENTALDADLIAKIKTTIRNHASPRHVPDKIIQVSDLPRTLNNKMAELAVRNVVHNLPVKNMDALANPESLTQFKNMPALQE